MTPNLFVHILHEKWIASIFFRHFKKGGLYKFYNNQTLKERWMTSMFQKSDPSWEVNYIHVTIIRPFMGGEWHPFYYYQPLQEMWITQYFNPITRNFKPTGTDFVRFCPNNLVESMSFGICQWLSTSLKIIRD